MSESSVPSSAVGTCRTEYKRQKIFLKSEKSVIKDDKDGEAKDPLPIVELKPFVKKVWRRENSLPGFYDRFPPSKPNNILRKHKDNKSDTLSAPVPVPDRLEVKIGNLSNNDQVPRKKSGQESPRLRAKTIHPKTESLTQKQLEHSQSFVPGFITRVERTKSTLMEIRDEDAPSRLNCGLKQSLDRKEIDYPPFIDLKSDKLPKTASSKKSIQYYSNSFRGSYQKPNGLIRNTFYGNSDEKFHQYFSKKLTRQHTIMSRPKTPFYDAFDRTGTLPSIQIGISSLRKRPSKNQGEMDELDLSMNDLMPSHAHKVGGITNALHVLSKVGAPTKVERQLTFQLEVDLRRFRRSRDYFPFDMTPSELAKYYPAQTVNLTNGEMLLRKGQESNAGPKKRRVREKSHKSAPDILETHGSILTESPRIDGDDINHVTEINREGYIVRSYNAEYEIANEIKENVVPNGDTQELNYGAIEEDITNDIKPDENDNTEQTSHDAARMEPSPIKSVDTLATTPFEEGEVTLRTLSPGGTSEIIRNVMDANILDSNVRSIETTARTIDEAYDDKLERSSTFLTSDHPNNELPEVIVA